MQLIKGGYQKGIWLHDRQGHTQEEIDFMNAAFWEAGRHDPRWLKLIWDIKVDQRPELRMIAGGKADG
ncbi:MAG: hypothetical protein PHW74_13135 [Desulfobacca sp.]|nr:hypothetical protein [Desulfobacca sp.]